MGSVNRGILSLRRPRAVVDPRIVRAGPADGGTQLPTIEELYGALRLATATTPTS